MNRLLNVRFAHVVGACDGDFLHFSRGQIASGHIDNAVGVDFKRDFNLRHAGRRALDAAQHKRAKAFVLLCHRALSL